MTEQNQRSGFSLVEVIVAMMILSVALLAMGASTGHVMAQIQSSGLRTERMQAVRQASEVLRSTDWAVLETRCTSGFADIDTAPFTVACTVAQPTSTLKRIEVVTSGPGYRNGGMVLSQVDTFVISIAQPLPLTAGSTP